MEWEPRGAFDTTLKQDHKAKAAADRRVTVVIRDNRDHNGAGMIFELKYLGMFENAFNHFRAACCKTCKPIDGMRFKMDNKVVLSTDTPKTLRLLHNSTTIIRVFSSPPGLQCFSCKSRGYPQSNGVIKPGTQIPAALLMPPPPRVEVLTLVMEDQTGYAMSVRTVSTHGFDYVMEAYSKQAVREREALRFFYEGDKLTGEETPKQLGLVDNDKIEVYFEQLGG
ncbi:Small ubiquitin-related modifier 1 [Elasticomyces elasticus]|nr:Small ubiquitin-related modifier 1 [Elasticomyces elasticus]